MKLNNILNCMFFSILLSFGCGDTLGDQPEENLSISELKEKLSERFPDSIEIVSIKEVGIEGYLEAVSYTHLTLPTTPYV